MSETVRFVRSAPSDAVAYEYVVLRCVPRVERGELVNVGVVVHSQAAGFLAAASHVDRARLHALSPTLDLDEVTDTLATIEAVCRGETGRGLPHLAKPGQRFGWIIAPRSTVIQPGPVHGGRCTDPAAALETLMDRLVRPVR